MSGFDWPGLLRLGVTLGLRPEELWRLTPGELAFLAGREGGGGALDRARLNELAAAFPDAKEHDDGR